MAKPPPNHGNPWSKREDAALKQYAKENTPTRVIALKMGRTPASISGHASKIGVSLKPTNQRPYNRSR